MTSYCINKTIQNKKQYKNKGLKNYKLHQQKCSALGLNFRTDLLYLY